MSVGLPHYYPPLGLVRSSERQGNIADEIHRSFYRISWQRASLVERAALLFKAMRWPIIVLTDSCFFTLRNGQVVARRTGKSIAKQFIEQMDFGLRQGLHPRAYYAFELFQPINQAQINGYLQRYETKDWLYHYLKSTWRIPVTPANDKLAFEQYLLDHDLPTVHTIAVFAEGHRADKSTPLELPKADLFLKPKKGRGGEKCMRYRFTGKGWQACGRNKIMSGDELLAHFRSLSHRTTCLIQQRYHTHSDLSDLAGNTLATVRVLSLADVDGVVDVPYAAFRMPRSHDAVVDNFHAGGIAASVDLTTGRLGPATDLGLSQSLGWVDHHPASGGLIRGRVLPYWPEVMELVRRAHSSAFKDRIMLGWDIAITDDGPIIVEGNAGPDLDIIQRVCKVPLGSDRFGEVMVGHLRAAAQRNALPNMVPEPA